MILAQGCDATSAAMAAAGPTADAGGKVPPERNLPEGDAGMRVSSTERVTSTTGR